LHEAKVDICRDCGCLNKCSDSEIKERIALAEKVKEKASSMQTTEFKKSMIVRKALGEK